MQGVTFCKFLFEKSADFEVQFLALQEEIDGIFLDLPGYRLKITGGSDNSGVPLRGDIDGNQRRKILMRKSKEEEKIDVV